MASNPIRKQYIFENKSVDCGNVSANNGKSIQNISIAKEGYTPVLVCANSTNRMDAFIAALLWAPSNDPNVITVTVYSLANQNVVARYCVIYEACN